jgi:hypothetical protein
MIRAPFMMRLLTFIFLTTCVLAEKPSPDAQARFVAGMSVEGTPLQGLAEGSSEWRDHAKEFDKAWSSLTKNQLEPISAWSLAHLSQSNEKDGPLYYMFSGPDFLYANTFFPRAPVYILCGTEPVGNIPDVTALSGDELNHALHMIHESLNSVLSFSFFITKEMKNNLVASKLTGTLPLLYVFLARQGCHVDDVKLTWLDKNGAFADAKTTTPGVRIDFTGTEGQKQVMMYFQTDLSNEGIKDQPGFMSFCAAQGTGNGFAKAASYLMHHDSFTTVRDFLLTHTRGIVQDDSGIPLRDFEKSKWMTFGYGNYVGPIELFKEKYQSDLASLYHEGGREELPFSFGYRWRKNESSLIYAVALGFVPKAARAE